MDSSRRRFFGNHRSGPAPFRPPWSVAEARFVDRCNRCDDCVKVCPTHLLVRGDGGFPIADFSAAACTFCGECARVCTTRAIAGPTEQSPWQFSVRISEACLPRQGVECRVCGEACGTGAIRFRPRIGGVALPEVDDTACSGCGACVAPCPMIAIERIAQPSANPAPPSVLSPVSEHA